MSAPELTGTRIPANPEVRIAARYAVMIYSDMQRTSIFLADEDRAAIRMIRDRYGVSTDSDAIRLAVRVLAEAKDIYLAPLPERRPDHHEEV